MDMSVGPYGPPSPSPSHTRTPHTTAPPASASATSGATVAPTQGTLPQTGADTTGIAVAGAVLLCVGIVLLRVGWRLRQR